MMNKLIAYSLFLMGIFGFLSCETQKQASKLQFSFPQAGTIIRSGNPLMLKLDIPDKGSEVDSVIYTMDGEVLSAVLHGDSITVDTEGFAFGNRALSAKVYHRGEESIVYSNI